MPERMVTVHLRSEGRPNSLYEVSLILDYEERERLARGEAPAWRQALARAEELIDQHERRKRGR